ncbi:MAG: hypothetical protein OXT74_04830, partial [Candidatus Poribacteria bacterium]|nr:hypothetical protein [Candidatus Poribacteria bacterium]
MSDQWGNPQSRDFGISIAPESLSGFAVSSASQSIFLCLTVVLLFDLALQDSIRCAIPDVVADDGYWQKSAWNAVMTRVGRDWSAVRQTAINCEYIFTHPLPQTQNRG